MRNNKGFTLIELLVAVVVIGVLAALVFPKLNPVKERTYVTAIKNSVNKAVAAEENYFDKNDTYVADACTATNAAPDATCTGLAAVGFKPDRNVTVTITANTNIKYGFRIVATHLKTSAQCGVAYGSADAGSTEWSGKIVCTDTGAPTTT